MADEVLIDERFEEGMANWWVEGEVEAWTQDGRLYVDADSEGTGVGSVATLWCRQPIAGDVKVEFDAQVVSSRVAANNINTLLFYSDPSGQPLEETRQDRADGAYRHYFDLNGYIFTFVRDYPGEAAPYADPSRKARYRMRRCPGFNLVAEAFEGRSEPGVTYHITIEKRGGQITYSVNGKTILTAQDDNPLQSGLLGLRTFRTKLWWDNVRVTRLSGEVTDSQAAAN